MVFSGDGFVVIFGLIILRFVFGGGCERFGGGGFGRVISKVEYKFFDVCCGISVVLCVINRFCVFLFGISGFLWFISFWSFFIRWGGDDCGGGGFFRDSGRVV